MSTNAGVWIDHQKAVIVFLTESGDETRVIESNVEKHVRASGGARSSTPFGPQDVAAGDRQERRFYEHLNVYYDDVLANLKQADQIFVLGPGEAKGEFQKRIKSKKMQHRIVAVETADKMTQRQLAARVREFFGTEVEDG